MTAIAQRIAPRFNARPAIPAVGAVVLALLAAHWWSFRIVPGAIHSLWGPYFLGPLGWLAAGAVAFAAWRRMPATRAAEHTVAHREALAIAALVGCFLVALQVITGMLANFGSSPFAHSPRWLATNLLFAGSPLLAVEMSRAALIRTGGGRHATAVLVATTLGLAAIQLPLRMYTQPGLASQAEFWGSVFIPLAATGLLAGFFVVYAGVAGGLLVSGPLVAFQYFSPFLPVAEWPILALVGVAGPAMGLWIAEGLFASEEEEAAEATGRSRLPSIAWVLTAVLALAIFWFSFGFFGYRPAFVPSHSMEPVIHQGDLVLAGPVEPAAIRVGDVILYQMPNRQRVLHRVAEIRGGEGGREFVTKGDNNNAIDLFPVKDEQVMGRYLGRVPKLGWVPIAFNRAAGAMLR